MHISDMNRLNDPETLVDVFCAVQTRGSEKQSLLCVAIQDTCGGGMGAVAVAIGPEFHDVR